MRAQACPALGSLLLLCVAHGAVLTPDNAKCAAGLRDFCAPIVRCWTGVTEIKCSDTLAYQVALLPRLQSPSRGHVRACFRLTRRRAQTLTAELVDEPSRDLKVGDSLHIEWKVSVRCPCFHGRGRIARTRACLSFA